jgi:hypothetical protein
VATYSAAATGEDRALAQKTVVILRFADLWRSGVSFKIPSYAIPSTTYTTIVGWVELVSCQHWRKHECCSGEQEDSRGVEMHCEAVRTGGACQIPWKDLRIATLLPSAIRDACRQHTWD